MAMKFHVKLSQSLQMESHRKKRQGNSQPLIQQNLIANSELPKQNQKTKFVTRQFYNVMSVPACV